MRVVVLRGLPCAGKSTFAAERFEDHGSPLIFSADTIMKGKSGTYHFDPAKVQDGHNDCWENFDAATEEGYPFIIIDNTNIALDEIGAYWLPAIAKGYAVEILTINTPLSVCLERNAARDDGKRVDPSFIHRLDERKRVMDALLPRHWKHRFIEAV
jgi:predicted kinase